MVNQALFFSMLGVLMAVVAASLLLGAVLHYHWTHYGIEARKISDLKWWYFGVSLLLSFMMAVSFFI